MAPSSTSPSRGRKNAPRPRRPSQRSTRVPTWILNATIVTQDEKRRVLNGHIHIVDGRIAEIKPSKPSHAFHIEKGAKVIDAAGLTILPGFVQAHIHLCQTLFRNAADDLELLDWLSKRIWVFEGAHTHETLYTSALLGIHELFASGTTCLLDMGTVRHTDAIFKAVRDTGIRASVGKCLMDNPKTCPPYLRESTEKALKEAVALFDQWHGAENDRIRVSYAPRFVISCTDELLKQVARIARAQKALVHTHACENRKEIELVKKLVGQENIEYLNSIGLCSPDLVLAHCIWLNKKERKILKDTGTHAVHCPSSNMKLASGFAKVPEMRADGINVALGADGAPCNNNLNMFTEMRLAALIHKPGAGPRAMRAQEVLDMATRDGAKALGWSDDIGSIEIGKKADLIALDLNRPDNAVQTWALNGKPSAEAIASSIVYSTQAQHLRWTMVDGRVVFREGEMSALDTKTLMERVRKTQARIVKRVHAEQA